MSKKSKYIINLSIEAEFETNNPYSEKDMGYLILHTLIQKGVDDISNSINNIEGFDNVTEKHEYLMELQEQRNILVAMLNDKMHLSVKKVIEDKDKDKNNHLRVIK